MANASGEGTGSGSHTGAWDTPLGSIEPAERRLYSVTYLERYFLGIPLHRESEVEVTQDEFIAAERAAGFHPKHGCGPLATGGFSTGGSYGRTETLWPTP